MHKWLCMFFEPEHRTVVDLNTSQYGTSGFSCVLCLEWGIPYDVLFFIVGTSTRPCPKVPKEPEIIGLFARSLT